MEKYKKLLIISHNCLTKTGSNGRTLLNYLGGWPKNQIAQMYLHWEVPDFEVCEDYFCITDSSIMKSILNRKPAGQVVKNENANSTQNKSDGAKKGIPKNSIVYLARELAWRSKLWNKKLFNNWLECVKPEIILVQAGDAGFLFEIAIDISRKFSVPVIVYNTEGYYFKKESYLKENKLSRLFYPLLNCSFKKSYEKLIEKAEIEIDNCDLLCDDYRNALPGKRCVIMNTSEFTEEEVCETKKEQIIYAGNLSLFRHKSLIEFANALKNVSPEMVVDVYGKAPNEEVKSELEECQGIRLHGFIAYEELKKKLRESKYLLHIESFDSFYKEDLKYAFSTKIADSLAVGACLFVYAPENMAVIQYLYDKDSAVVITEKEKLESEIAKILGESNLAKYYATNGRRLAERNHNIQINRNEFQSLLLEE